jgi:hypothetical protein
MEGKRSKKRKRAKRLKFQKEKDDSPAVEEIDERKEEEEEESSDCAFAKRTKSQGPSKSSTFLEKVRILLSLLLQIHRKAMCFLKKRVYILIIINYYDCY